MTRWGDGEVEEEKVVCGGCEGMMSGVVMEGWQYVGGREQVRSGK